MIRISYADFQKMVKMLEKESQGGPLRVSTEGTVLKVQTLDRSGKEMMIELSDTEYPFMPRITKTETF